MADPDHELVITRLIDAPRERIFAAWTDPKQLARWWGPHGMTTPVCEMDLRPGGVFRTVMRARDGTEYPHAGVFLELVAPERIVFTDAFGAGWQPSAQPFMTAIVTPRRRTAGRGAPRGRFTGRRPTARSTRSWASTRAGARAWTGSSSS
jgi:uncharacterized protein YndB with AHSA1/START domain